MKNNTENENKKFLPKEDEIIVNRTISFDNKCFINYINNYEKTRIIFKNNFLLVLIHSKLFITKLSFYILLILENFKYDNIFSFYS